MTALVTGAGKQLGRAMALYLAGRGHDVAVHYATSRDAAEAVVAEIRALGRRAKAVQADLLVEAETEALIPTATDALTRDPRGPPTETPRGAAARPGWNRPPRPGRFPVPGAGRRRR